MRRARIKAVAALPPRRKNQEKPDGTKNKSESSKETAGEALKSPKTPRSYVNKNEGKYSPAPKSPRAVLRTPPALLPISSPRPETPVVSTEKVTSPKSSLIVPSDEARFPVATEKVKSSDETRNETLKLSEKVPVITSTSRINSTRSVFLSPQLKSPHVRLPASPLLLSPEPVKSNQIFTENNEHTLKQIVSQNVNERISSNKARDSVGPCDYNIPSIPESVTDDPVMDGIVPLKSMGESKPTSLMKDDIITDNAEALFDPIIPLPSPSKVRPKLRPVPRLGPHRRNSVQGSASESEDESRRALLSGTQTPGPRQRHDSHTTHSMQSAPNRDANRIRNDSVCSTVSQPVAQPLPALSPVKEKHFSKARRQEMVKRMWRRRHETVKRESLTMYDLIFYNPTTNPIVPDPDQLEANKEESNKEKTDTEPVKEKGNANSGESEEDADDPPETAAPVPQLKLGPNGEIMLDETSLVIKQSDAKRKISSEVREGAWTGGGGHYKRSARTADWSAAETVRFYRALAAVGTDFSLMAGLFPDRTRKDLKLKFKKEERQNGAQVDLALRSATSWDVAALQAEFSEEREMAILHEEEKRRRMAEEKKAERERMQMARELRIRHSKGAKALESTIAMPGTLELTTAEDFLQRAAVEKRITRNSRKKEKILPPILDKPTLPFATITPVKEKEQAPNKQKSTSTKGPPGLIDMATLSRVDKNAQAQPSLLNGTLPVPSNIESGSLVVLRVNDPSSPSKTMLQTYIAHSEGKLVPVALPSALLSSVMGYMRKGTPKNSESSGSSPQLVSPRTPNSAANDRSATPSVIQVNPSPAKKPRHSSFTITNL